MYSALTYDVVKSYDLIRVWDKQIRNGYITLETNVINKSLCVGQMNSPKIDTA